MGRSTLPHKIACSMARERWKGSTPEQRSEFARQVAAQGAGRPRKDVPRCPCGQHTLTRCQARGKSFDHDPSCEWYRERAIIV